MRGGCKTKGKRHINLVLQLIRFSHGEQVNNFAITIHEYWNRTIKLMDNRWWEPGLSLLAWEVADKQKNKAGMSHVVMDQSSRHQHKLMFRLIQMQMETQKYLQMCYILTRVHIYTHIFLLSQLRGFKSSDTSVAMSILHSTY